MASSTRPELRECRRHSVYRRRTRRTSYTITGSAAPVAAAPPLTSVAPLISATLVSPVLAAVVVGGADPSPRHPVPAIAAPDVVARAPDQSGGRPEVVRV